MKNGIILLLAISLGFTLPLSANTTKPRSSTDQLRKEVAAHFKARDLAFMNNNVEIVKVSFLINAKNELVISNVEGEDPDVWGAEPLGTPKGPAKPRKVRVEVIGNVDFPDGRPDR